MPMGYVPHSSSFYLVNHLYFNIFHHIFHLNLPFEKKRCLKNSKRINLDLVVNCIPPALHLCHAKPRPPSRASQTASIMGTAEGACRKYLPLPHSKHLQGWHLVHLEFSDNRNSGVSQPMQWKNGFQQHSTTIIALQST